jgi:hypothetical protein
MRKRDVLSVRHGVVRTVRNFGAAIEALDWHLRQWPVVGVLFLALTIVLAATMLRSG